MFAVIINPAYFSLNLTGGYFVGSQLLSLQLRVFGNTYLRLSPAPS